MRRTIARSALVFASVLLIIALAGCGGGSKKTPVAVPGGGGGNGGGGGTDPATPTADPIMLPSGSTLAGTTNIAAGKRTPIPGTYSKGRTSAIMCPKAAGDAGCVVTVAAAGATATGGATVVPGPTNQMVWQANNGPDGDSNGMHAVAVAKRAVARTAGIRTALNTGIVTNAGEGSAQGTTSSFYPTPSVEWNSGTDPKVGLTVPTSLFSAIPSSSLGTDAGKLTADDSSTPPSLTGWRGTALSKDTSNAKTVHAIIYTDAAAPTGWSPEVTFGDNLDLSGSALSTAVGADSAPTDSVRFAIPSSGGLTDITVTMTAPVAISLRGGGALTTAYAVTVNYKDSKGMDGRRSDAMMRCVSAVCRVAGGQLHGEWEIDAALDTGDEDPVFMTLGSWMVSPDASTSVSDVEFGVFAYGKTGSGSLDRVTVDFLDGKGGVSAPLKYKGLATGLYVQGSYGTGATPAITGADVGSFVADADLTATWTSPNAATDNFAGVSGTINNFKENGVSLPNWIMSLGTTSLTSGTTDDLTEVLTGTTNFETGAGHSATGTWSVGLYYDTSITSGETINHALGTFNAATDNSSPAAEQRVLQVVGAFGAKHVATP